tara:strand:+ start:123 stop:410 length:288 start_codon:yes stop_codon:yes gene_type:complete
MLNIDSFSREGVSRTSPRVWLGINRPLWLPVIIRKDEKISYRLNVLNINFRMEYNNQSDFIRISFLYVRSSVILVVILVFNFLIKPWFIKKYLSQ